MREARVWAGLLGLQRAVVEDVFLGDEGELVVAVRPGWRERDLEFPRFRGHLTACAVEARKDGVCRAENPPRIP